MKIIITYTLFILASCSLFAQQQSRLVAMSREAYRPGGYEKYDSTHFYYSNGRGGYATDKTARDIISISSYSPPDDVHCDQMITFNFENGIYAIENVVKQEYNSQHILQAATQYSKGNTPGEKRLYSYNGKTTLVTYKYWLASQNNWFDKHVSSRQYSKNQLVLESFITYQAPPSPLPYISKEINQYRYRDNISILPDSQIRYSEQYGNPIGSHYGLTVNFYNISGLLDSAYSFGGMPGNWSLTGKTINTYDLNNDLVQAETFLISLGTWAPFYKTIYTYDATHNLLTEEFSTGNGLIAYQNVYKFIYEYNSYNQLVFAQNRYWDETTSTWIDRAATNGIGTVKQLFYYELYYPVSIDNKDNNQGTITITPNPAKEYFTLNYHSATQATFKVKIYDITGKVVREWTESNIANNSRTISVNEFPSGTYIIKCIGDINHTQNLSVRK